MEYNSGQEAFWASEFGNDYIDRNVGEDILAANLNFFSKALRVAQAPRSCIEFGANVGNNLRALKLLFPALDTHAIEINAQAVEQLSTHVPADNIFQGSISDFEVAQTHDLTLIKGVLIHINPDLLEGVYDRLVASTGRYLLVAEYYNPSPVAIPYRGHEDRLFKRDFAGEIMDRHPQIVLLDYGFSYRRDPKFPQDDITWFLMEKTS